MTISTTDIRPQIGPQEQFLRTKADIAIFGGAAGGGKTYALLLEALRNITVPRYNAVIFRRKLPEVRNEGGLWDQSSDIYPQIGGKPYLSTYQWRFPTRSTVRFWHLEQEKNRFDWQGAEIVLLGFDELTHFTKRQFWYMLSRCRTTCGVRPYIRATCNPDPDSFVADLVSWWIDEDTGYAIPERSGKLRYFVRIGDTIEWGDSPGELKERFPDIEEKVDVKSLTFIASSVFDNKLLMEKDPAYLGNLRALNMVDRERLLMGNWKIRPTAGNFFRPYEWLGESVDVAPANTSRVLRYWDRAGTAKREGNDPAYTAGLRMSRNGGGTLYIEDMVRFRGEPPEVKKTIRKTAERDTITTSVYLEQDPGQAGKMEVQYLIRELAGFDAHAKRPTGDKVTRAKPVSAQMEAGNIKLVKGKWNKAFLEELDSFPDSKFKDQVDSLSGAFEMMTRSAIPRVRSL